MYLDDDPDAPAFPEEENFADAIFPDSEVFTDPGDEEEFSFDTPPEFSMLKDECEKFFSPGGTLQKAIFDDAGHGENRPQQLQMALAISEALAGSYNLAIEAPTGVGKSFAYLLPLVLRARTSRHCAVIATGTINLQEQLVHKDIPFLEKLLGTKINAAIAKGRRNYLCRRRFALLCGEQKDMLLPLPSMVVDLAAISQALSDGDTVARDSSRVRVEPAVWDMVCCETGNCLGKNCEFFSSCLYFKARRQWESADIIIANHALFFSDLALKSAGNDSANSLLPVYSAVLLDEAHTIENTAAEHFGIMISQTGSVYTLNRLFNPDNAKGLLVAPGTENLELRNLASAARDEAYGFFTPFADLLREKRESALEIPENFNTSQRFTEKLLLLIEALARKIESEDDPSLKTELGSRLDRLRETIDAINEFQEMRSPGCVYYAEMERNQSVSLRGTPIECAELLSEMLFRREFPVILCSATLTVNKEFDYFIRRSGFVNGKSLRLDSPFDPDKAQIRIIRGLPDPRERDYFDRIADILPRLLADTDGKAFVLFTSYQQMLYCAEKIAPVCAEKSWQLLVQGKTPMSRSELLAEFKRDINSVLFGTDSFWTGVDVPGESLSQVIITKLPFAVPSHPLTAARHRKIEATGKSSFAEYSLPEAVLKFRQGAGRLIRRHSDEGIITILDRRIIGNSYGRLFLGSVPYPVRVENLAE